MDSVADKNITDIPQWKKDLIARLKNNNPKKTASTSNEQLNDPPQLFSLPPHHQREAGVTDRSASVTSDASAVVRGAADTEWNVTRNKASKMVQERHWVDAKHPLSETYGNGYHKDEESDPEDLHYGPGIVKKLKNKYLSLALRESNSRPSILQLRKATSLENVLDDDGYGENRRFQSRANGVATNNVPNRYRNAARGEMKRARSVETISRLENAPGNRQSLHEDMLAAANGGNDYHPRKTTDNKLSVENITDSKFTARQPNRPKRIQPVMNEKEKPPADFVKQAKMIFERRPEQRTRAPLQTGDVAAKVDSFNNIIVKTKVDAKVSKNKNPPIKHKKPVLNDKTKSNTRPPVAKPVVIREEHAKICQKSVPNNNKQFNKNEIDEVASLPSPIPDVSRIDYNKNGDNDNKNNSLSETPDLILTSSPLPNVSSPTFRSNSTDNFIKEEIRHSSPILDNGVARKRTSPVVSPTSVKPASPLLMPSQNRPVSPQSPARSPTNFAPPHEDDTDAPWYTKPSSVGSTNATKELETKNTNLNHHNDTVEQTIPTSQPLKIEVNGFGGTEKATKAPRQVPRSPPKFSPPPPPKAVEKPSEPSKLNSATEIENRVNAVKSANKSVEVVNRNVVTKKAPPREQSATTVFNFTNRKDVPDYISNDKSRTPSRPEMPKPGEGGIILLPSSNLEVFIDEDEELLKSLEGPPSPCDVTFINDNILIDGKSSFVQKAKSKRAKLTISFVDDADIFEYPSETSLMLEESLLSPIHNLSGTCLANYTPKTTEDFQPGITRSIQPTIPSKPDVTEVEQSTESLLKEADTPFSSGTNSDILF